MTTSWTESYWEGFLGAICLPHKAYDRLTKKKNWINVILEKLTRELCSLTSRDDLVVYTYLHQAAKKFLDQQNGNLEAEVAPYSSIRGASQSFTPSQENQASIQHKLKDCLNPQEKQAPMPIKPGDCIKNETPFSSFVIEELENVSKVVNSIIESSRAHSKQCQAP